MKYQKLRNSKIYFAIFVLSVLFNCENESISSIEQKTTPTNNMSDSKRELVTINTYDSKKLTYELIDGQNIFEGDVILTEDQIYFLKNGSPIQNKMSKNQNITAAPGTLVNKWTNSTVNFKISFTSARSEILTAINHLRSTTNINFIEQTTGNYIDFVSVVTNNYCGKSNLGMIGGRQALEISTTCVNQRTIIHEILHALGFFHEHTRQDRDNHIVINWNNIDPDYRYNFDISINQPYGTFDYNSVMLYPSINGFAINPSIATMTKKSDGSLFYGGSNLSTTDINALLDIYYVPNTIKNVGSYDILDVGANSNGDYVYVKKNRLKYELYKNGLLINSNFAYSSCLDITNDGVILTGTSGYNSGGTLGSNTIDISEGNGKIFCLSQTVRTYETSLYIKNGTSWTKIVNNINSKRLTVDNIGNAWLLADNEIKIYNTNGNLTKTISLGAYANGIWDKFNDIGNAGNAIFVSLLDDRNGNTKLLKYSITLNQFIEQPKTEPVFSISKLDGSNNGSIWFSK